MASSKVFLIGIIFAVLFLTPCVVSARQTAEPISTQKTRTLPVRKLLHYRHMIDTPRCPWCTPRWSRDIGCVRVQELWEDSGCTAMSRWEDVDSICDLIEKWNTLDKKLVQQGAFLAWCIWHDTNMKVFENKMTPNALLLSRAARLAEEYGLSAARVYKNSIIRKYRIDLYTI